MGGVPPWCCPSSTVPPSSLRTGSRALGSASTTQRSPTKYEPPYGCASSSQAFCPAALAKVTITYAPRAVVHAPWRSSSTSVCTCGVQPIARPIRSSATGPPGVPESWPPQAVPSSATATAAAARGPHVRITDTRITLPQLCRRPHGSHSRPRAPRARRRYPGPRGTRTALRKPRPTHVRYDKIRRSPLQGRATRDDGTSDRAYSIAPKPQVGPCRDPAGDHGRRVRIPVAPPHPERTPPPRPTGRRAPP